MRRSPTGRPMENSSAKLIRPVANFSHTMEPGHRCIVYYSVLGGDLLGIKTRRKKLLYTTNTVGLPTVGTPYDLFRIGFPDYRFRV